MRFSLPLQVALCSVISVVVATTPTTYSPSCPTPAGTSCASQSEALPFMRLYNPTAVAYFYTTSTAEADYAVNNFGYVPELTVNVGKVFPSPIAGTVPLYRLYNTTLSDNFYTISDDGVVFATQQAGYTFNGIAGYVYSNAQCGAIPFYRMYNAAQTVHFYTTSIPERNNALNGGYSDEGIDGYILPE